MPLGYHASWELLHTYSVASDYNQPYSVETHLTHTINNYSWQCIYHYVYLVKLLMLTDERGCHANFKENVPSALYKWLIKGTCTGPLYFNLMANWPFNHCSHLTGCFWPQLPNCGTEFPVADCFSSLAWISLFLAYIDGSWLALLRIYINITSQATSNMQSH